MNTNPTATVVLSVRDLTAMLKKAKELAVNAPNAPTAKALKDSCVVFRFRLSDLDPAAASSSIQLRGWNYTIRRCGEATEHSL